MRNKYLVSLCDATHYSIASTLHALFEVFESRSGGESNGYTDTISRRRAGIVPTECQMKGASSWKCSRWRESSSSELSRKSEYFSSSMKRIMVSLSCSTCRFGPPCDEPANEFDSSLLKRCELLLNGIGCDLMSESWDPSL